MIPQIPKYFSFIITSLMSSVFFFTFLLFQFELPLLFGFSLLAGRSFALGFVFLKLLLQCLLRLCAYTRILKLFSHVSLTALRVISLLLDFRFDGCAEPEVVVG